MDWSHDPASETTAVHEGLPPLVPAAGASLPLRDPERLGALLSNLEPQLAAVALGFTRDREAARDVVQNAFEKVLRHGEKFRGDSRVSTWIHRIVTNEALMWLRSQRRRRETQTLCDFDDLPFAVSSASDGARSATEVLEHRQQLDRLRRSLVALSREERDVVRCCALGGQSYAEYAGRRGMHPSAAKSRAYRARRRLAVLLQE